MSLYREELIYSTMGQVVHKDLGQLELCDRPEGMGTWQGSIYLCSIYDSMYCDSCPLLKIFFFPSLSLIPSLPPSLPHRENLSISFSTTSGLSIHSGS